MWVAMALAVGYMYEAEQCGQYLEMAHQKTAEFLLDSLDYWYCRVYVRSYMYVVDLPTGSTVDLPA